MINPLMLVGSKGLLHLFDLGSFHEIFAISILNNKFYIKKKMYCVKCKKSTLTEDVQKVVNKNGRPMLRGICIVCRKIKTQFVKSNTGGDLTSSLNSFTSNIKLPWAKFPGEMHIPGMNFAGPGTNLDERLTSTGAYKEWSKPVDRVDNAAYHHDLAYQHFPDTATRNEADKIMLEQMNAISNPTIRERIERGIIKPIISTKAMFGLSHTTSKNYQRTVKKRNK
jgi:hypothetical protein